MEKKILFIGAGLFQSFAIRKAKSIGLYVLAVDRNESAIGFNFCDKYKVIDIRDYELCLQFAESEKIDGVLGIASEYGSVTASLIAKRLSLPGVLPDIYKITRDKYVFKKLLVEKKVYKFEHSFFKIANSTTKALPQEIVYPVILKPVDGSGSKGVHKATDDNELNKLIPFSLQESPVKEIIVEPFIQGQEYGVECIVVDGVVRVLGVLEKRMTSEPFFSELGHICPASLSNNLKTKIVEYVVQVIETLSLKNSSVNIDLILDLNGMPHVIDLSPRMGGNLIGSHIVQYSTGCDIERIAILQSLGEKIELPEKFKNEIVQSRILNFKSGKVKKIKSIKSVLKLPNVKNIFLNVNVGQFIKEYKTNYDSAGYIIVSAPTYEIASSTINKAFDMIQKCIVYE